MMCKKRYVFRIWLILNSSIYKHKFVIWYMKKYILQNSIQFTSKLNVQEYLEF